MWFERKLLDPNTGEQKDKLASPTQRGLEELIPSRDMILGGGLGLRAQPNGTYPPYSGLHQSLQRALLLSASMVGSQMYGPLLNIMRPLSYSAEIVARLRGSVLLGTCSYRFWETLNLEPSTYLSLEYY